MEYRKINLYHILEFLKDKMQSEKYATYNVKVRQANYSHYSSIRSWCIEKWNFKKELLHQQNTETVTLFSAEDIAQLIKYQAD